MKNFYQKIVDGIPALRGEQVWCKECGFTLGVDPADCLAHGWPKHCQYTMTIDSPNQDKP